MFQFKVLVFSFSLYTLNQLIKIGKGKIYRIVLKNNKRMNMCIGMLRIVVIIFPSFWMSCIKEIPNK